MINLNPNQLKSPIFRTAFWNLMNGIIGSGILALPYAMANLGWLLFSIMILAICFMTSFSINNILLCCEKMHELSYENLANKIVGKNGKRAVIANIWVHTLIAMCSYVTVVKNQLPELVILPFENSNTCVAPDTFWLNGNFIALLVLFVAIIPLSALKRIDFLRSG